MLSVALASSAIAVIWLMFQKGPRSPDMLQSNSVPKAHVVAEYYP